MFIGLRIASGHSIEPNPPERKHRLSGVATGSGFHAAEGRHGMSWYSTRWNSCGAAPAGMAVRQVALRASPAGVGKGADH